MKKITLFVTIFIISLLSLSAAYAQTAAGQAYTVQAGDWLSKIAEKEYGDPLAYPAIVEATNNKAAEDDSFTVIDNPDLIEVGQKIWLPTGGQSEESPAEVTATEVITFVPSEIPTETRSGACFTGALGLGREDAYRCMTEDNMIYDPCFVVDETPTVVCGADPTTGATGFTLALTEPLPAPDLGNLSQPWLVELADGTICGLLQGTRPGTEEVVAGYGCADQTYLLEDLQRGDVWLAEQALFDLGDDGFVLTESETTALRRVWR